MNFLVNPISLRRSASKMVGGGKIPVRIKPHTHQRRLEVSSKPRAHQDPETPQRMRQSCVWVSPVQGRVSSGLPQGQGLQVQQTWVWHKPSWRRLPCVHQNSGERSSDPTRDWARLGGECPGVSGRGVGQQWPAAGSGALSAAVLAWDLLKEALSYLHYLRHSLASGQTTGREHSPTHQQKIGLKIYWPWPHPSQLDPVSPSVSLSPQKASINFLTLIHQRADRMKTITTEN